MNPLRARCRSLVLQHFSQAIAKRAVRPLKSPLSDVPFAVASTLPLPRCRGRLADGKVTLSRSNLLVERPLSCFHGSARFKSTPSERSDDSGGTGSDKPPKKDDEVEVRELAAPPGSEILERFLLVIGVPWCNLFARAKLRVLGVAFPGAFDFAEFSAGAKAAFEALYEPLCHGDRMELRGLVADDLLENVLSEANRNAASDGIARHELKHVQFMGILSARPHAAPTGDAILRVRVLFFAVEDAVTEAAEDTAPVRYRLRRLHRWTFERFLPSEDGAEPDAWQVVEMDKRKWPPLMTSESSS
eukprot:TRINITY_DN75320_c0_g1_i1.p1 TRINITY_DN75320_c0_g1~~TRINITY_DN75320_c0_g1_i1.p1  ORF type:complete len:302 (+),score=46.37 TRINITY_DN75320_c0_g1_i1:81-986(+)